MWAQFFLKQSTDIQSCLPRANAFPVSLAHHVPDTRACHENCDNNVLQPFLCTYSDFCQSLISLGYSKLLLERWQLRSLRLSVTFPSYRKYPWGTLSHKNLHPDARCLGPFAGFSFLPYELSLYILKAFLLYSHTRLGGHKGRFNHLIDSFIVWCHDNPVFWKKWGMLATSSSYVNQVS